MANPEMIQQPSNAYGIIFGFSNLRQIGFSEDVLKMAPIHGFPDLQ